MKVCVSCSSTTGATRMAPTTSHQANACSAVPTGNLIRLYRAPSQSQQLRMFPPALPARSTTRVLSIQRRAEVLVCDSRTTPGKGQATWRRHPHRIKHRNDKTYTLVRSDGTPNSRIETQARHQTLFQAR